MSKKKKIDKVFHQSSEEATLSQMPKFNGYGVGYGPHKNKKKYSRKEKYKDSIFDEMDGSN